MGDRGKGGSAGRIVLVILGGINGANFAFKSTTLCLFRPFSLPLSFYA